MRGVRCRMLILVASIQATEGPACGLTRSGFRPAGLWAYRIGQFSILLMVTFSDSRQSRWLVAPSNRFSFRPEPDDADLSAPPVTTKRDSRAGSPIRRSGPAGDVGRPPGDMCGRIVTGCLSRKGMASSVGRRPVTRMLNAQSDRVRLRPSGWRPALDSAFALIYTVTEGDDADRVRHAGSTVAF
jgi:hypothetical protein